MGSTPTLSCPAGKAPAFRTTTGTPRASSGRTGVPRMKQRRVIGKEAGFQERAPPWLTSALCAIDRTESSHLSLPGGSVVKNRPANAGDTGSVPNLGRSHVPQGNQACAAQLLNPSTLQPQLANRRGRCREKPTRCNQRGLPAHHDQRTKTEYNIWCGNKDQI